MREIDREKEWEGRRLQKKKKKKKKRIQPNYIDNIKESGSL